MGKYKKKFLTSFQAIRGWEWSDGSPVGMQIWGSPFSPEKLTGKSCNFVQNTSQSKLRRIFAHRYYCLSMYWVLSTRTYTVCTPGGDRKLLEHWTTSCGYVMLLSAGELIE